MKFKTRVRILCAFVVLLCGMFWFFFYTSLGLVLQTYIALKIQPAYLRFYSSRVAAMRETYCGSLCERQLFALGEEDLWAARDAASAAIAQGPQPFDFYMRGRIDLDMLFYTNAVADFDQALELWNHKPWGDYMNPEMASNHLAMAKACAEAKQKYWEYWKNRPANPSPPSESKPPTSAN